MSSLKCIGVIREKGVQSVLGVQSVAMHKLYQSPSPRLGGLVYYYNLLYLLCIVVHPSLKS